MKKTVHSLTGKINSNTFLPLTSTSSLHVYSLAKEQYGFSSKLSIDNASDTLIHEILTALNNEHTVGVIFCNLRKAFYCVNHGILLST